MDESYHLRDATFGSSPVLLIGAEVLPGKIAVKVERPKRSEDVRPLMVIELHIRLGEPTEV